MGFLTGFMTLVGAGANLFGYARDVQKANDEYGRQIAEQERLKAQQLKDLDLEFEIASNKAKKNADRQDKGLTLEEMFTSDGLNGQFDALRLGQEGNVLDWNIQAMQNDQQKGQELSAMAASGTRSSSMADAVEMEASVNSQALQLQEDQTRAQNKIQLANLFGNLGEAVNSISLGREDAMDLRTSYDEGGDNWRLYQNERQNTIDNFNSNINQLQRGQRDLNKNAWKGGLKALFGGASSGFQVGAGLQDFASKWSAPSFNTVGKGAGNAVGKANWSNLSTTSNKLKFS